MHQRTLLFAIAMGLPFLCQAQEANRFEASPFWGYQFGGKTLDTSTVEVRVSDHSTYGIRAGYALTRKFAMELQVSRSDSNLRESRTQLGIPFRTDYLLAYGKFYLMREPLEPYVALGAGIARMNTFFIGPFNPAFQIWPIEHETRTRFTGSLGVGVDWLFTRHVGARLDARGYAIDIHRDAIGVPCTTFETNSGGALVPVQCSGKRWLLNGETSGGLIFKF